MIQLFKKFSRKTYRLLRHPKHRRKSRVHDWVAHKVFDRAMWKPSRNTLAGGLAVGLVVAMLPPLPIQMLVAAVIAIFLKVNVPAAAAGCWFSNPVTWVPLMASQYKIGSFLLPDSPGWWPWMNNLRAYSMGAIVMGAVIAFVGYFLAVFLWDMISWFVARRHAAKEVGERAALENTASVAPVSKKP